MDFRHRLARQKLTDSIPEPSAVSAISSPVIHRPIRRTSKTPSRLHQKKRSLTRQESSTDEEFSTLRSSVIYSVGDFDDASSLLRRSQMNARAERQAQSKERFKNLQIS